MMPIKCKIDGASDSTADYAEATWLAADASLRQAVADFFDAGATVANIEEAIAGGLEDAEAG